MHQPKCFSYIAVYPGKDIMHNINAYLALTNKLREIERPMPEQHIINLIVSSLPESYARVRSSWSFIPEAERTIGKLTSQLKAEETIIKSFAKPAADTALAVNHGIEIQITYLHIHYIFTYLHIYIFTYIHIYIFTYLHIYYTFTTLYIDTKYLILSSLSSDREPRPGGSRDFQNHSNRESKRGRYDWRGRGKERGRGRGRGKGVSHEPSRIDDSTKSKHCLWCNTNTHNTEECFSMERARKARQTLTKSDK